MTQLVERGFFAYKLADNVVVTGEQAQDKPATRIIQDIQILRTGSFNHPKYGEFDITSQVLGEMVANFEARVRGIDLALDYFHDSDKEAAGWLTKIYLNEERTELWGQVDWTPKARRMLAEREIRYFSPDFAFEWTDPESSITYKNVLFGGGLTNRPFVKDMQAIVASEKDKRMNLQELTAKVMKLDEAGSDLAKKHEELQKAHADLQKEHGDLKAKMAEMMDEESGEGEPDADDEGKGGQVSDATGNSGETMDPKKLKEEHAAMKAKLAEYEEQFKKDAAAKVLAEKEAKFAILLSEGKACVAQKDAFVKGDMEKFLALAGKVNLSEKGSNGDSGAEGTEDFDAKVLKLAEEKMKANPKLGHKAFTEAFHELKSKNA